MRHILHHLVWAARGSAASKAFDQGQLAKAEKKHLSALKIAEEFGPDDPRLAMSLEELAKVYHAQRKYIEAEPLFRRALTIREKVLGPEHPATAEGLSNLAGTCHHQSKYTEAEALILRALAIQEKILGPEHLEVVTTLTNAGLLYVGQGRYAEAEPLGRRALSITEKLLGTDHPEVAACLSNLAYLFTEQGRYAEAEPFYQRCLNIQEKALGSKHPDLISTLENYTGLLRKMGRDTEAARFKEQAGEINKVLSAFLARNKRTTMLRTVGPALIAAGITLGLLLPLGLALSGTLPAGHTFYALVFTSGMGLCVIGAAIWITAYPFSAGPLPRTSLKERANWVLKWVYWLFAIAMLTFFAYVIIGTIATMIREL